MAELFDSSTDNIGLHLKKTNADQELEAPATTEDFLVVQMKGTRQVTRRMKQLTGIQGAGFVYLEVEKGDQL